MCRKGFHLGPVPIKGHEFGLKLAPEEKAGSDRLSEDAVRVLPNGSAPVITPRSRATRKEPSARWRLLGSHS